MRTITSGPTSRVCCALMAYILLLSCLNLPALADDAVAQSRPGFRADTSVRYGLYSVRFRTPQGAVILNLPADLRLGEPLLASVSTEPKGRKPEERAANLTVLNTYAVTLGAEQTTLPAQGSPWRITLNADGKPADVILKDRQDIEVVRAALNVSTSGGAEEQADRQVKLHIPIRGQAGRPLILDRGEPWDLAELHVLIAGKEALLLAASPRNVIVMTPNDVYGKLTLQIRQGDVAVYEGRYRNDRVRRSFNPWPYVIGVAVIIGIGIAEFAAEFSNFHPSLGPISGL